VIPTSPTCISPSTRGSFYNFYARYWAAQLSTQDGDGSTHSFRDETAEWMAPYFASSGSKARVRDLFATQVRANI
jgi:hypothetical protein